jgi:hypothetical protein
VNSNDRHEVAEYLENEAANRQDAEFGGKLIEAAAALRGEDGEGDDIGRWFGESGFPEDHPSQLVADISNEFGESTSDTHILLDALWTKDLTLVSPEWRESMAVQLDREAAQIALLLGNAAQIARTLTFKEATQ